ncbi:228_t:CDS:2 [Entrophospora sp. SA101]|nr:2917_t:CDS:2 [Entrophospora sp. SA101]CAJ0843085.1 228_t:CDS:2 [Entrophospora sp. SA101]
MLNIPNNKSQHKLSKKKSDTLPSLRIKPNQRPKSALPFNKNKPSQLNTLNLCIDNTLNNSPAGDLISHSKSIPTIARSPSSPTLRSEFLSIKGDNKDFSYQNSTSESLSQPPSESSLQSPSILPSITLTDHHHHPSVSSQSSLNSSSTTSSTISSSSSQPPSSTSITSNDTDEYIPLDITAFLAAPRLTQRVRLKSGRVVSFSEVGDRNGFPVFVFLGMGCVRYFIAFFDDLASSYGLRLLCPDRPGVGLSDDVKENEQHVLKWPDVIEELCEILGIDKFFILAHSAGAPHALACAIKIPERLQGTIYLVCPWVSTTIANNFKWLKYVPTPVMKFTNTAGISLQQMLHGRQPYSTKPSRQRNSGALALPISSLESKQQLGMAILKASFAENLSGASNDLLMCFERRHSFGFSYTDINHPVHVFHGTKDDRIPVSAVKWMESNMPDCKLTLIEGGKHSLLLRAEIVDTIFKTIAIQLHDKNECKACWNKDDDPFQKHQASSPDCPWVLCRNYPNNKDNNTANESTLNWDNKNQWPTSKKLENARIKTFGDDNVVCPYCNISLEGWEPGDDPVKENTKRSITCLFFAKSPKSKKSKAQATQQIADKLKLNEFGDASLNQDEPMDIIISKDNIIIGNGDIVKSNNTTNNCDIVSNDDIIYNNFMVDENNDDVIETITTPTFFTSPILSKLPTFFTSPILSRLPTLLSSPTLSRSPIITSNQSQIKKFTVEGYLRDLGEQQEKKLEIEIEKLLKNY